MSLFTTDNLKKWEHDERIKSVIRVRTRLRNTPGYVMDYLGNAGKFDDQKISIALNGSKNHHNCLILCELAFLYGARGVVELGTNLGISSTYLAIGARSKNSKAKITTGDCSGKRLNIARSVHADCNLTNIEYIEGLFEDTADRIFNTIPDWSFAFIDGDHTFEGTIKYYEIACKTGKPGNCIVFDDVEWSGGMIAAWQEISRRHRSSSQRIGDMGMILL